VIETNSPFTHAGLAASGGSLQTAKVSLRRRSVKLGLALSDLSPAHQRCHYHPADDDGPANDPQPEERVESRSLPQLTLMLFFLSK
jgi:hypothetical protein